MSEVETWQYLTERGFQWTAIAFLYDLFNALDKELDASDDRRNHCVEQLMQILGDADGGQLTRWQDARNDELKFRWWVEEHVDHTIATAKASA